MNYDVSIIGGGLAGMVAAVRLAQLNKKCILVDAGLPEAKGKYGGFAKFSGAKFSLPPAGMGLLNVIAHKDRLWDTIVSISNLLDLNFTSAFESLDTDIANIHLRSYKSLILTPSEIDQLIENLTKTLNRLEVPIFKGTCKAVSSQNEIIKIDISSHNKTHSILSNALFYAGGRLGEEALQQLNLKPTNYKGLDVGARFEFSLFDGLKGLRKNGPDAKIIKGNCRTFCLNVPGKIFRYPFETISIPGGVVADSDEINSNFGILYRTIEKTQLLEKIRSIGKNMPLSDLEAPFNAQGSVFGDAEPLARKLYGCQIVDNLIEFGDFLSKKKLVNWNVEHFVHLPLIDWHWNTYSTQTSFKTTQKGVYCIGDSSGHARGLLQAAISGWIAAEEYSNES